MRRLGKEPLVHFCALGLLLFGFHRAFLYHSRHKIVLSPAFVATQPDLDRFVDEEVLYREALALGLDRGDVIVRRRLVQKMEMILSGNPTDPSQAQLEKFLDAHRDRYDAPPRLSFHHVFTTGDSEPLARAIENGADWQKLGEPFVPGRRWTARSETELAAIFGAEAAHEIMAGAKRVRSRFGNHLIFVEESTAARRVSLDEVRSRVREDWLIAERRRLDREALAELRARYSVEPIEPR
jgi:hypothetical protein